jgi:hypothetical protein
MFKVVTDQLKVSQGWVRCGQCAEVFDASMNLLPGETASLPPSAFVADEVPVAPQALPQSRNVQEPEALQPLPNPNAPAEPEWAPARLFADRVPLVPLAPAGSEPDDAALRSSAADFDPAGWKRALHDRQQDETGARHVDTPSPDMPPRLPELVRTEAAEDESGFGPADRAEPEESPDVSFVRDARRKAFWKKPWVRGSLALLSLGLLAALLMQWVLQQKDSLAALEPRLAPLLQALCSHLQCEIRPPRHIESLVIDGSSFNRIGPDAYRLGFTLKNTGSIALEMPSLEVTLTDTQDQAVLRRVLLPAQFGASTATLAARSELAGAVSMKVSGDGNRALAPSSSPSSSEPSAPLRVAGYRILAFYP